MSETEINDLPTEIIIAILRNVDRESLKNAALTCKLWKELIESSCPFSLSLDHLNNPEDGCDEPWMDFLLTTNRKFYKFKLRDMEELGKNRIIDIFTKHGTHISKLFMFNSCLDRLDLFVDVLKSMPNLEHLIFYQTRTPCKGADVPTDDKLPEMLRLKTLESVESDTTIIKCFKRSKLTEFKLLEHGHFNQSMPQEPALDLLRTQCQMKSLALRSINYNTSTLFQADVLDGCEHFQLSKLSLLDIELRQSPNDYNNLIKFLKTQTKTIEFLELGRAFPDPVYEFMFAKFKNLKSLRLMVNELPKDMEFYERLDKNQSITQLIFMDSPPPNHLNVCPPSLKEFIRHVPNVTDLTLLQYCDRGTLQFISTNLTELKRLAVMYFSEAIFGGLRFPNLLTLCIHQIEDDVDWENFTKNNPDLKELTINTGIFSGFSDWIDEKRYNLIEKVTKNLRLQTLRIGSYFPTNEHFYEVIREYGTDLKVVDLHRECALSTHIMNGIPGLRFHDDNLLECFHDLKYWNTDDYDGNLPDIGRDGNWDDGGTLDPFEPLWMDIDVDDDEYDDQDDYDDYDDFVDEFDEHSDYDDR